MNSRCIGPIVSGRMCGWLICEHAHASLSHLHHSTLYCVWRKDGSYLYLGIRSYIALSCMICMSYICLMFCSAVCHASRFLQINTSTTPPASRSKLICIVSIGSTIASGTQSLLTGAQLQPSCSRLSVLSLTLLPDRCGFVACGGQNWVTMLFHIG